MYNCCLPISFIRIYSQLNKLPIPENFILTPKSCRDGEFSSISILCYIAISNSLYGLEFNCSFLLSLEPTRANLESGVVSSFLRGKQFYLLSWSCISSLDWRRWTPAEGMRVIRREKLSNFSRASSAEGTPGKLASFGEVQHLRETSQKINNLRVRSSYLRTHDIVYLLQCRCEAL